MLVGWGTTSDASFVVVVAIGGWVDRWRLDATDGLKPNDQLDSIVDYFDCKFPQHSLRFLKSQPIRNIQPNKQG